MKTLLVPFQIDSRGGLAQTASTQQIVEQQIVDILMTSRFERIMNPDYGAALMEFIFTPVRNVLLRSKAEEVRTLLNALVLLASIEVVELEPVPGEESTLSLTVLYRIDPSPTVFTLTRTITGLVTDETVFGEVI
jgi:phage baseplate assembly protein W